MADRRTPIEDHVDEATNKRRRAQLDKQAALPMVNCEYHTNVRYLESRPKGCPKCQHLFDQGRAPNGRLLPGVSGNPTGQRPGYTHLGALIKRYAAGRDEAGRTMQEKIARNIVEGAARGERFYVELIAERLDPVIREAKLEVADTRAPAEPLEIPDDESRDEMVAQILGALQTEDGLEEDILSRIVDAPNTEQ